MTDGDVCWVSCLNPTYGGDSGALTMELSTHPTKKECGAVGKADNATVVIVVR
jgi:hypothetical protein